MDKVNDNKNNKIEIKNIKCGCEHCKNSIVNVVEYVEKNKPINEIVCPNCNNNDLTLIMNNEMKDFYGQAKHPKHIDSCCEECKLLYYCPKCDLKFGYQVDIPEFKDIIIEKNNQPQINMENLNERCKKLPIIKAQTIEWHYPEHIIENGEEIIPLAYPLFPQEVDRWIEKFYELDLMDKNYIESYKLVKDKNIEELTREEILTMLTYYIRQDRFYTGLLAKGISEGILEKLSTKLKKITK